MWWWVLIAACGDVGAGEVDGAGSPVGAAGPPAFVLGGDAWLPPGGSFDLAVTGGPAGAFVGYVASSGTAPPLFCPAATGCFDLSAPATVLGVTLADGAGVASYSRAAPATLTPLRTYTLQAAGVVSGQGVFSTVHTMTALARDLCVSNFSWPWATLGEGADPTGALGATGVRFLGGLGLVGGDAEGDLGGWSDGQSVMTPAWVVVGGGEVRFDAPTGVVGLSVGRAGGGATATVEIAGSAGGSPVFASTVTSTGAPVVVSFAGPVDRVALVQVGGDSPAFRVDDLMWRDFGRGCP